MMRKYLIELCEYFQDLLGFISDIGGGEAISVYRKGGVYRRWDMHSPYKVNCRM